MSVLRVLLVDDDPEFLGRAEGLLAREKYTVATAADLERAAGYLQQVRGRAVVLCELSLAGRSTLVFLKETLRKYPHIPFTVLAGSPSVDSVIEALKQGAYDFLKKPVDPAFLRASVARSIEKLNLFLESEKQERENRELISRNRIQLQATRSQSELRGFMIAMAAHDFKSVITVLDGYYQVMREHCTDCPRPMPPDLLNLAGRSIARLRAMADMLFDHEAAELGRLRINPRKFDLTPLIKESADFYRPYAGQKNVALRLDDPLPSLKAKGDPGRVLQILDNILFNAIRHTPANGEIWIGAAPTDEGGGVMVWVKDTGIGISKARLRKIVSGREIASLSDADSRIGIGLLICRKLLEIQNGKLSIESASGKGTKVTFVLNG
jgi:two-component system, sensor histidine kinase and response regulator